MMNTNSSDLECLCMSAETAPGFTGEIHAVLCDSENIS